MNSIHFLLLAVLDLLGVFFNVRMLLSCFKDKTKYKFLQKCRGLSIFQCACQFVIVITGAVDSWRSLYDRRRDQLGESCSVVKLLSISVMFIQACNLTAILIIDSEHPLVSCRHQDRSSKLKLTAALSLGLIGSTIIWWFCGFPQYFISPMVIIVIQVIILSLFVVLLLAAGSRYFDDDPEEDTTPEALINCSLLWNFCKENKRPIFFIALLLICMGMILSGATISQEFEQTKTLKESIYAYIIRFIVGIVLPVTFGDLIDQSSYVEGKDQEGTLRSV